LFTQHDQSTDDDKEGDEQKMMSVSIVRRSGHCWILSVDIADPDNKDAKISQTTTICSTFLVPLCNKKIGIRKTTCFEIFHQVSNLLQLVQRKSPHQGMTCVV
jgi:hypothetical protein